MRNAVVALCLLAGSTALAWEKLPPPDHKKANIDGRQGVMFASAVENERGEWDPVRLPGCKVYLAPGNALHEHFSFPCNDWFVTPAEGSHLVWLATENLVSSSQTVLMARQVPYRGFGSVAIHHLQPAGFVTVDVPIPADHDVRFVNIDTPGKGFFLRVSSRNAGQRFPMPPGRVVAGIFNSRGDAVAHHPPLRVEAGETTAFRIAPPERGSDLLVVLSKPVGQRDGPPIELLVKGAVSKAPDVLLDQRIHVVGLWYGLTEDRVILSASSPNLELRREVVLHPRQVSTVRAELMIKEPKK